MVYFRKRLPESMENDSNERIIRHGLNVIHSSAANDLDDEVGILGGETGRADNQQTRSDTLRTNQGSLLIDATCAAADIRQHTNLSLLNEGRELSEMLIDAMHTQVRNVFGHKLRTHRNQAR